MHLSLKGSMDRQRVTSNFLAEYGGAAAAYSLRALNGNGDNVVRVRRASDNDEKDFTAEQIELGEMVNWVTEESATADAFVTTWYDQSGNGRNATQATTTRQPQIVSAGSLITQNSNPAIDFNGSLHFLGVATNNPFTFTGGVSHFAVTHKNSTAYKLYETIWSAGTTGNSLSNDRRSMSFGFPNGSTASPKPSFGTDIWSPSGIQTNNAVSVNTSYITSLCIDDWSTHRTDLPAIGINGTSYTSKTYDTFDPTSLNVNPIKIGTFDTVLATSYFAGKIQELIIYPSDQSATRTAIESNINSRYSIY